MEGIDTTSAGLAACLDRLARGDLQARDGIIALCGDRLRALASRMLYRFPTVRRWDDTDDVFQNAALRLHRALAEVRPQCPREIMALAATQLQRELLDLARRHSGKGSYAANHASNVVRTTDDDRQARHIDRAASRDVPLDRWTAFHEAIEALPPTQREVFRLVWYVGADQKSIARLMGCSERTVKSRWREAREAVKAALDGESPV